MQVRLVHDELQKCHRAEGENHYQGCGPIARVYKDLLKAAKARSKKLTRRGQGLPLDRCIDTYYPDQRFL